jgi:hypothetical protein
MINKDSRDAAIRDLIAVQAYEMWESQGRPVGYDKIHWRQAEQEVMKCVVERSLAGDSAGADPVKSTRKK